MDLNLLFHQKGISLSDAFNSIEEGILVVCPNFELLYCNDAARRICEVPIEENFSNWATKTVGLFNGEISLMLEEFPNM